MSQLIVYSGVHFQLKLFRIICSYFSDRRMCLSDTIRSCIQHIKPMPDTAKDLNFGPFSVLLGIVLGTLFSIAFGLAIVCFVFWVLQDEEPRLLGEVANLVKSTGIFTALSVIAGMSFFGSLHKAAWRHLPMAGLWLGLLLAGSYYWP
jgi:hypothetical protein